MTRNQRNQVQCPIEFMFQPLVRGQGDSGAQNRPENIGYSNVQAYPIPNYVPGSCPTDPMAEYRIKLRYGYEKKKQELEKEQASLAQKAEYERWLCDLKQQYRMFLDFISCTVYCDSGGNLMVSFLRPDNNAPIISKQMINVKKFKSILLTSYYPHLETVLGVSWEGMETKPIFFRFKGAEGVSPEIFAKRLKSSGLLFLVSGNSRKKAAEALLAYALQNAVASEILFFRGWGKTSKGNWHFVRKGEITMQEVLKNAWK